MPPNPITLYECPLNERNIKTPGMNYKNRKTKIMIN